MPTPIGTLGGLNLYGYVNNNPINRIDSTGLCSKEIDNLISILKASGKLAGLLQKGQTVDDLRNFLNELASGDKGAGFRKILKWLYGTDPNSNKAIPAEGKLATGIKAAERFGKVASAITIVTEVLSIYNAYNSATDDTTRDILMSKAIVKTEASLGGGWLGGWGAGLLGIESGPGAAIAAAGGWLVGGYLGGKAVDLGYGLFGY